MRPKHQKKGSHEARGGKGRSGENRTERRPASKSQKTATNMKNETIRAQQVEKTPFGRGRVGGPRNHKRGRGDSATEGGGAVNQTRENFCSGNNPVPYQRKTHEQKEMGSTGVRFSLCYHEAQNETQRVA